MSEGARRITRTIVVVLLGVALAACGSDSDAPTMTQAEAKSRTEAYLAQVVAALPRPANPAPYRDDEAYCFEKDSASTRSGQVMAMTARKLPGIAVERHAEYFQAFRSTLESMGFQPEKGTEEVTGGAYFVNPTTRFYAALTESGDTDRTFTLSFTSPCVWPDGTRPPSGAP